MGSSGPCVRNTMLRRACRHTTTSSSSAGGWPASRLLGNSVRNGPASGAGAREAHPSGARSGAQGRRIERRDRRPLFRPGARAGPAHGRAPAAEIRHPLLLRRRPEPRPRGSATSSGRGASRASGATSSIAAGSRTSCSRRISARAATSSIAPSPPTSSLRRPASHRPLHAGRRAAQRDLPLGRRRHRPARLPQGQVRPAPPEPAQGQRHVVARRQAAEARRLVGRRRLAGPRRNRQPLAQHQPPDGAGLLGLVHPARGRARPASASSSTPRCIRTRPSTGWTRRTPGSTSTSRRPPRSAAITTTWSRTSSALNHFPHGCARVFSNERWALTGEAGVFTDPFYSPGSDFIGIGNDLITEMILRDGDGDRHPPRMPPPSTRSTCGCSRPSPRSTRTSTRSSATRAS